MRKIIFHAIRNIGALFLMLMCVTGIIMSIAYPSKFSPYFFCFGLSLGILSVYIMFRKTKTNKEPNKENSNIKEITKQNTFVEQSNVNDQQNCNDLMSVTQMYRVGEQNVDTTDKMVDDWIMFDDFVQQHGKEASIHIKSFGDCYTKACRSVFIDDKIYFLQETVNKFYEARDWFYQTEAGKQFFQDFYEHLFNSRNSDFSYIDPIKEQLDLYIRKRDYITPKLIELISSNENLMQKDVYKYLPEASRYEIQQTIRELEEANKIVRTKKSNSYLLSLPE